MPSETLPDLPHLEEAPGEKRSQFSDTQPMLAIDNVPTEVIEPFFPPPRIQAEARQVLGAEGIRVVFGDAPPYLYAVRDVSLHLDKGEMLAIVGESGSGKSVLLQALLGIQRGSPGVVLGRIEYELEDGTSLKPLDDLSRWVRKTKRGSYRVSPRWKELVDKRFRPLRGRALGLVLQNGKAALNPFLKIGTQLDEALARRRPQMPSSERLEANAQLLAQLGFRDPTTVISVHPHELSGGMAQRAMLAIALTGDPEILFLDEVTTGLDVTLQAEILMHLREYRKRKEVSGILVTHHLGHADQIADRVIVMRRGEVVQSLSRTRLMSSDLSLETYTADLVQAIHQEGEPPETRSDSTVDPTVPLVRVEGVSRTFTKRTSFFRRDAVVQTRALDEISVDVYRGEVVAIVGESGSGKTTLARLILGLDLPTQGRILVEGRDLNSYRGRELRRLRQRLQILFQNPYTSLNPGMRAIDAVAESLIFQRGMEGSAAQAEAQRLLDHIGVGSRSRNLLGTLSGGERRRIGLVRALESSARLLVLDEPSTGLDAIHRMRVADLLSAQREADPKRSFIIISHDLAFVRRVADRVVVLYRGKQVEQCSAESLTTGEPHHPYTEVLLESALFVSGRETENVVRIDELRARRMPLAAGCCFRSRCPRYDDSSAPVMLCDTEEPALVELTSSRVVACHARRPPPGGT